MPEFSQPLASPQSNMFGIDAEASLLAQVVLEALPHATTVHLDAYVSDDTLDCGPARAASGRMLIEDISDLPLNRLIESIVAGWSFSSLSAGNHRWFSYDDTTGEVEIDLAVALNFGAPSSSATELSQA